MRYKIGDPRHQEKGCAMTKKKHCSGPTPRVSASALTAAALAGSQEEETIPFHAERGYHRDAHFRADHQGDVSEAQNSHESAGRSVERSTTESPWLTRFAVMRKPSGTADPQGSLAST